MDQVLERFRFLFQIICQASAMSMIVYWIYVYTLNKDLCTIDYKTFHQDTEDPYPLLSLCFNERSSDKMFRLPDLSVNQSTYIEFLGGKYFDARLLDIDYDNVSIDMSDYIIRQWGKYVNGTDISGKVDVLQPTELFMKSSSWFGDKSFYKCFSLKVPQIKGLERYGITLKNSIFTNGLRPSSTGFQTLIHYPNQLMTSRGTIKYAWFEREINDTFIMRFKINGIEILKRRRNGLQPCNQNWKVYDDDVLVNHLNKIGCRAPYQNPSRYFPVCDTQEKIGRAKIGLLMNRSIQIHPASLWRKFTTHSKKQQVPTSKKARLKLEYTFLISSLKKF